MANLNKIEIELKDIKLVKNLVELLEIHFNELPKQLQHQLKSISETGLNDFTADDFHKMFPDLDQSKIETSQISVISVNKLLKKCVCFGLEGEYVVHPEHFYLKYDGKTIIEW